MSLPRPKMSFLRVLLQLLFAFDCLAQRLTTPDLITVSNFLPRPSSLVPNNTLAATPLAAASPSRPIPSLSVLTVTSTTISSSSSSNPIPTSQIQDNDVISVINPLRLLPVPNSPTIFRCNPKNTHSHPKTHKLLSQCRENTFCSSSGPTNGTCIPILCRRDEFPFGFGFGGGNTGLSSSSTDDPNIELDELNLPIPVPTPSAKIWKSKKDRRKDLTTTMVLPELCSSGSFCPDDGSGCRSQIGVGGSCELGRDEQCGGGGGGRGGEQESFTDETDVPICLHLTCMYANATLNQPCIIENTTYITDLHTGDPNGDGEATYTMNVIKHNCRSPNLFFCDPESTTTDGNNNPTCQPTKELKQNCRFDAECASGNCAPDVTTTKNSKSANNNYICSEPVGTTLRIAPWQWGASGFCIFGAMLTISLLLTIIHRRQRHERYKELREYYHEQMTLRRSILALHGAAAERYSDEKPNKKP